MASIATPRPRHNGRAPSPRPGSLETARQDGATVTRGAEARKPKRKPQRIGEILPAVLQRIADRLESEAVR